MASITIRNLDDALKSRLRVRAAHRQRSMEDEVRHILKAALSEEPAEAT
ncbi:MAG: plasmid stabilization protein, partial [Proteobacteria bacterium]|nr:plasmid stabilization protein [Pseudomonadota bacterium]